MLVTEATFEQAVSRINQWPNQLAVDTETNGLSFACHVVSVQIALSPYEGYYFPFRHGSGYNLPESYLHRLCAEVLRPNRPYLGQNYGFDVRKLSKERGYVQPVTWADCVCALSLTDENLSKKLETALDHFFGGDHGADEREMIAKIRSRRRVSEKKAKGFLWELPAEDVYKYGLADVCNLFKLRDKCTEIMQAEGTYHLFNQYCEYNAALSRMTQRGVLVDWERLGTVAERAATRARELEIEIAKLSNGKSARSPKQMAEWLDIESTARESLNFLLEGHPDVALLLEHRKVSKIHDGFCKKLFELRDSDGRIRPSYGFFPRTGRLSCSGPNLQQFGSIIKECIIPDPGNKFIDLDYSQIELRIASHYHYGLYGDCSLRNILMGGGDMHQQTADASGLTRKEAKVRNFAIVYGAGPKRLAMMNRTRMAQERKYIDVFNKVFPGVARFRRDAERTALRLGYIEMWSGRRRHLDMEYCFTASSGVIQGGGAEVMRRCFMRIEKEIPEVTLSATVHDSGLAQAPADIVDGAALRMKEVAELNPEFNLPLTANYKICDRWS